MKRTRLFAIGIIAVGTIALAATTLSSNPIEDKIDRIEQEIELAEEYAFLNEEHYCVSNLKRIDSLYRVIDKMLSNRYLDYTYQIRLIKLRQQLDVPRSLSVIGLDICNLQKLIDKSD